MWWNDGALQLVLQDSGVDLGWGSGCPLPLLLRTAVIFLSPLLQDFFKREAVDVRIEVL